MLYRIYTEDVPLFRSDLERAIAGYYKGFTILNGTGYWEREREKSLIVEIVTPEDETDKILSLAEHIKDVNKQSAVLVQRVENHTYLV